MKYILITIGVTIMENMTPSVFRLSMCCVFSPLIKGLACQASRDYYCKRPILCLASSKILTSHPPLRPASVYPPPLLRGEDTLATGRGGWGVNILEDARHSSVLYLYRILFVARVLYETRPELILSPSSSPHWIRRLLLPNQTL
jgi:hypothetical protein